MSVQSTKALITESYLTDIGDAIRAKLGVNTTYYPSEMGNAVRSINTMAASVSGTLLSLDGASASVSNSTLNLEGA